MIVGILGTAAIIAIVVAMMLHARANPNGVEQNTFERTFLHGPRFGFHQPPKAKDGEGKV